MKLILLMCIEEYKKELRDILLDHEVPIYSETEISGYRLDDSGVQTSWFSGSGGGGIYSQLFFSFLDEAKSDELMKAVKAYNEQMDIGHHPLRAFLLNVESAI